MKKLVIVFLCLTVMFSLISCFTTTPKVMITDEDFHRIALDSKDSTTSDKWSLKYYVDKFGDATDEAFIYGMFTGTFSNSATNNSDLYVKILVEENRVGIEFIEYRMGNNSQNFDKDYYTLSIKGSDGVVVSVKMKAISTSLSNKLKIRLIAVEEDGLTLFKYLCSGELFKGQLNGDYSSSYIFTVDPTGLPEMYKKLVRQENN